LSVAPLPALLENKLPIHSVDKYDLLSTLGRGGMGCVYRARLEGPGGASKQVALKLIHAHLSENKEFILMFLDEMRVAMAMEHRNIVQTFDAGRVEDRYYLVMELVGGLSLRELINKQAGSGGIPLDIALFIAMEVSAALAYAHRFRPESADQPAGVVHRDVSPGNILLSLEGDVKLADFGVAKAAGRLSVTMPDLIKGKLSYMAPEQARGQVEARSDIFALGAVLYELACGTRIRKSSTLDEVRAGGRTPVPPSRFKPEIAESLDELILRCLHSKPAERFANADELRRALAEEVFRMQVALGSSRDPFARLRAYLGERWEGWPEEDAADQAAGLIAQAVLQQAHTEQTDSTPEHTPDAAQETDPRNGPSDSLGATINMKPPDRELALTRLADRGPAPPSRRRRRRWIPVAAASAGLFAISLAVVLWLAFLPDDAVVGPGSWTEVDPASALRQSDTNSPAVAPLPVAERLPDDARRALPDAAPTASSRPPRSRPVSVVPLRRRGSRTPQRRPPRRDKPGYFSVNSIPWAAVYIDGKLRGQTPLQRLSLRPGSHRVRLVNPKHKLSRTFKVKIRSGETVRRAFVMR
jgi:serine/threonine protein kinase